MPVPTESSTRKELQEYITSHKLNIKKNQNKGPLLKAIRAAGHRGGKKPPPVPYNVKGKRVINPKTGKARKRAENADTAILGASPGPAAAKAKAKAKKAVPKGSHRMPDGSIMKNKDMKSSKY